MMTMTRPGSADAHVDHLFTSFGAVFSARAQRGLGAPGAYADIPGFCKSAPTIPLAVRRRLQLGAGATIIPDESSRCVHAHPILPDPRAP